MTAANPGFVDVANGNYALKPDAAVFKKIPGFENIPFEKIGLHTDEFRRQLPSAAETGRKSATPGQKRDADKNFGT